MEQHAGMKRPATSLRHGVTQQEMLPEEHEQLKLPAGGNMFVAPSKEESATVTRNIVRSLSK
ncbi:unnamed protein product [Ixodes pacificus]